VLIADADGSNSRLLGEGTSPVWSPDGLLIAMISTEDGTAHAWIQGVDGGERRRIGDLVVAAVAPAWSPDGQVLLVSADGFSLIDVATGSVTPLTSRTRSSSAPLAWSIGGPIAFTATESGAPGVFVIEPDGSGLKQVLGNRGFEAVATWSPDGRLLLLADDHTGSPVTIVDPGTGDVIELDTTGGITRSAAWQSLVP
jgi:TolB protein